MATMIENLEIEAEKSPSSALKFLLYSGLTLFFSAALLLAVYVTYMNAPTDYSVPTTFTIESGASVREVAMQLREQGIVRSESFLYLVLATLHDPTNIKASTYVLDQRLSTTAIAEKLVQGDFGNDLVRLTVIEGERAETIAQNAEGVLLSFDRATFLEKALPREGRLFPDTYFVPETYTADELVRLLEESFAEALIPYESEIANSDLSLEQILVLASIIEREANTAESMKNVASVLLNRISIGMPLQADASIEYILDKPLSELTPDDLKIDSPYNTYVNPGLPPTPIGNPGLDSIEAVLRPNETPYYYYITDENGVFYFAETYQEHLNNIEAHLR